MAEKSCSLEQEAIAIAVAVAVPSCHANFDEIEFSINSIAAKEAKSGKKLKRRRIGESWTNELSLERDAERFFKKEMNQQWWVKGRQAPLV